MLFLKEVHLALEGAVCAKLEIAGHKLVSDDLN
jgi:hypothetical protein